MTLKQALLRAAERLSENRDIDSPALEAEVLLRYVLQITRAQLFSDLNETLSPARERDFAGLIERCRQGEPLAYITRNREFYGLDFYVDPRVLIPRPESELLVDLAGEWIRKHPVSAVADIGTGSGAIAVSLAVNLYSSSMPGPHRKSLAAGPLASTAGDNTAGGSRDAAVLPAAIYAVDISPDALEVARINCEKHRVSDRVILLQGDLLAALPQPVDILIANLPYVKKSDMALMPSSGYEPALALDGGESGLDIIFRICDQINGKIRPGGCVLLEIGQGQSEAVSDYLSHLYPAAEIEIIPDLAGIERVIKCHPGRQDPAVQGSSAA